MAYYSKAMLAPEENSCTTRKELLVVVKAFKLFRPYLYGWTFRLQTDHASLIWFCRRADPSNQVLRWLEILAELSYWIEHQSRKKNGNTDGLSRLAVVGCKQCQNIERRDDRPLGSKEEGQLREAGAYSWEEGQL